MHIFILFRIAIGTEIYLAEVPAHRTNIRIFNKKTQICRLSLELSLEDFRWFDSEEFHPFQECRNLFLHEALFLGFKDDIAGGSGHIVANSTLIVYDTGIGEFFIGACHSVRVDSYGSAILPYGKYALLRSNGSAQDLLTYIVADLQIYWSVRGEIHSLVFYCLDSEVIGDKQTAEEDKNGQAGQKIYDLLDPFWTQAFDECFDIVGID